MDKNIYSRGIKKRFFFGGGKEFIPDFTIYRSNRIFIYRKLTNNIYLMKKFKGKYFVIVLAKNLINSLQENDYMIGNFQKVSIYFPNCDVPK